MPAAAENPRFPRANVLPRLSEVLGKRPARAESISIPPLCERYKQVPRGKHLSLAGDPFRHVHIVVNGSFKVYATSLSGEEQVLGFFLPGDALGLESVTDNTHRYSTVALEDATVSELSVLQPHGELEQANDKNRQALLQHLCFKTIANNYSSLHNRSTRFAEQRLSSFLIDLWDRLASTTELHRRLALTMSRQDISDYLGLALGTISRTFAHLEKQSLLRVQCRSVEIIDLEALRRLACSVHRPPVLPCSKNRLQDS